MALKAIRNHKGFLVPLNAHTIIVDHEIVQLLKKVISLQKRGGGGMITDRQIFAPKSLMWTVV